MYFYVSFCILERKTLQKKRNEVDLCDLWGVSLEVYEFCNLMLQDKMQCNHSREDIFQFCSTSNNLIAAVWCFIHVQVQSFEVSSLSLQMSCLFFCIQLFISVLSSAQVDVCLELTAELGFAEKTCAKCSVHGQQSQV